MKLLSKIVFTGLICFNAMFAGRVNATLLTFDELQTPVVVTGLDYATIPNGYGGLLWNNFGVLNGATRPADEGYHNGMVSPNNVAFNFNGSAASVSLANGSFNLNSADLTLALNLNTVLDIRVLGYLGTTLLYDNTYEVNSSAPTLINFDYVGINNAIFITSPSQQFAMDNLSVNIPEKSSTIILLGTATLGLSILQIGMRKRKI